MESGGRPGFETVGSQILDSRSVEEIVASSESLQDQTMHSGTKDPHQNSQSVAAHRIDILSLFPDYFRGPFDVSMLKRGRDMGHLEIRHTNIRDFAENKNGRVDDRPFGGGPGMVLCPGPVARAIRSVKKAGSRVIYLSPQGPLLTAAKCEELAKCEHLVLLCGHYEGVDERVLQKEIDEEISIGDYVLTNGCAAAIVLVDAMARFIPGVIGHPDAVQEDSFQEGIFDSPHYTRPENFEGMEVPPVLLGGNHAEIRKWRKAEAKMKTGRVRPDLLLGEHCEPLTSHTRT